MIHPKVKWAAVAAAVVTGLTALLAAMGPTAPAWLAAAVTGIAAAVAGYSAPALDSQDPEAGNA
jgi:hypothetical protein